MDRNFEFCLFCSFLGILIFRVETLKKISFKNLLYISFVIFSVSFLVVFSFLFSERNKRQYIDTMDFMGKKFTQIVYGKSKDCENVINMVRNESFKIEETISSNFYNSDVDRINKSHGKWVKVEDVTIEIIQKLIEISYNSDGIFNFVFLNEQNKNLDTSMIRRIRSLKFDMLEIDEQSKKIKILGDDVMISLDDAIDGLICNKAIEIYKNQRIEKAKIQIGNISAYLNDNENEIKNGFMCKCGISSSINDRNIEEDENNSKCKIYHRSDAIVVDILSKIYLATDRDKFKKILDFFI